MKAFCLSDFGIWEYQFDNHFTFINLKKYVKIKIHSKLSSIWQYEWICLAEDANVEF